jgi:hypothetical protein
VVRLLALLSLHPPLPEFCGVRLEKRMTDLKRVLFRMRLGLQPSSCIKSTSASLRGGRGTSAPNARLCVLPHETVL